MENSEGYLDLVGPVGVDDDWNGNLGRPNGTHLCALIYGNVEEDYDAIRLLKSY
jgi:hypothetical protein